MLAHICGDDALLRAFHEGRDIHAATAAEVWNLPIDQVPADKRRDAKAVNFGIVYGSTAYGLAMNWHGRGTFRVLEGRRCTLRTSQLTISRSERTYAKYWVSGNITLERAMTGVEIHARPLPARRREARIECAGDLSAALRRPGNLPVAQYSRVAYCHAETPLIFGGM